MTAPQYLAPWGVKVVKSDWRFWEILHNERLNNGLEHTEVKQEPVTVMKAMHTTMSEPQLLIIEQFAIVPKNGPVMMTVME